MQAALVVPEDQEVLVALVVPGVREALGVSENPAVPVELVVPAEAVLVQGHRPVQLALPQRTKSVTANHHRDQVRLLAAEEDLAGVAETTRVPAAAEAAIAWAEAVTAAVAVGTVAAVVAAVDEAVGVAVAEAEDVVVAAADAGGKRKPQMEKIMKTEQSTMTSSKIITLAAAILAIGFLAPALIAAPEKKETAAKQEEAQATPQPGQKQFDTPKQAADALIQVAANFDVAAAKEILGAGR